DIDDTDTHRIDLDNGITITEEGTDIVVDFTQFCVLLYLELEDEDLEACFGDDCDEKGIRRTFNVRKLLIDKSKLLNIIREVRADQQITQNDLFSEANACFDLKDLCIERLGYYGDKNLSLASYDRFDELYNDYQSIVQNASVEVGKALFQSYDKFKPVIGSQYQTAPFQGFNADAFNNNNLYKRIEEELHFKPFAIQYAYDFLLDLRDAYDEFRDVACEVAAVCRPDTNQFPRHLMLDLAIPTQTTRRSGFRQYFQPSPIHSGHGDLRSKARLLHQRMVQMVEQFSIRMDRFSEIRITPSESYGSPLSHRSIPYYFDLQTSLQLVRLWSYQKSRYNKQNLIPSYHAEEYSSHKCALERSLHRMDKYPFLRIEGHIGKNYEQSLAQLERLREELNLPIKVVGVKLSNNFANTGLSFECRFDDLQNLYKTYRTELECLLDEQMLFFRNLKVQKKESKVEEKTDKPEENTATGTVMGTVPFYKTINLFTATEEKHTKSEEIPKNDPQNVAVGNYDIQKRFPQAETGTLGMFVDNISTIMPGTQQPWESLAEIPNILMNLNYTFPQIYFLFMKPVQLARNIQQLLNTIPERLEDLDIHVLEKAFQTVVDTSKSYKKQLEEEADKKGDELDGREEIIIFRLDKLIYSCVLRKLKQLYKLYLDRVEEFQKMNLLSEYAKKHSGMEHLAGVPSGGTFVMVYVDRNEDLSAAPQPVREFGTFMVEAQPMLVRHEQPVEVFESYRKGSYSKKRKSELSENFKTMLRQLSETAGKKEIGIEPKQWYELGREIDDQILKLPEIEPRPTPPDHVVVADFALPYLCKSDCPELATMVISQLSFTLPKMQFCKEDDQQYEFNIHPSGGVVEGPGVSKEGDSWLFTPSKVTVETEEVRFTYRVNNQTAVFDVKILNPKASFKANIDKQESGETKVTFVNQSTGANSYKWEFGDGNSSREENPVHIYGDIDKDSVVVTLEASNLDCTDEAARQVDLPKEKPTQFALKGAQKSGDTYQVCENDDPYFFALSHKDEPILGDSEGVFQTGAKRSFSPQQYTPGEYELKYREKSMKIKVLAVPEAKFEVNPRKTGSVMVEAELINKSDGSVVEWVVDGKSYTEENPIHTFRQVDQPHNVRLTVEFKNGCRNTAVESNHKIGYKSSENEIIIAVDDVINKSNELDNHLDTNMDNELFEGENVIYEDTKLLIDTMATDFNDMEIREKYIEGDKNAEVGNKMADLLSNTSNTLFSEAGNLSDKQVRYVFGFYETQLNQLLDFTALQKKDITANSNIGQAMDSAATQLNQMKDAGLIKEEDRSALVNKFTAIKNTAVKQGKNSLAAQVDKMLNAVK
ncbi:MAG: PKD domain-containing protein, partial [Balneolaceae bacterium]|nr:PKD domain-containing protein [Balneolaceae bacterium]